MSGSQAGPPMSVSDIYANARRLGAYLKEKSPEIDEVRRLPPEVAARGSKSAADAARLFGVRPATVSRLLSPKTHCL